MLATATEKFRWVLLAWCLMTNHYHFVIQLQETGLSSGMQWLNGGFSRLFNVRHGRDAHLFRNRFSARLLETEEELLTACRYVVRNPVDAGVCRTPSQTRWTSYRACAGLDPAPLFLARSDLLALFGMPEETAADRYREFIAEADDPATAL